MKKENSDSLKFLRNLLLLLSLYVKIANSNHRCLNLCFFIGQFNDFLNTIFFSSPTVALIVAVFLDNTLDYKDSAKDRGMPWWVKFRTFKGDTRNEEFYTLPFNLNRFFPPSWSSVILKEAVISRKEMITPSYCREDWDRDGYVLHGREMMTLVSLPIFISYVNLTRIILLSLATSLIYLTTALP